MLGEDTNDGKKNELLERILITDAINVIIMVKVSP